MQKTHAKDLYVIQYGYNRKQFGAQYHPSKSKAK